MGRNKKGGMRLDKGFTMIELIIVVAIMGILSAILVPSFTNMTRKTRLRADISTAQQVQTLIELYMAENDGDYPGIDEGIELGDGKVLSANTVEALMEGEYIKKSDIKDDDIRLQTKGIQVVYKADVAHLVLDVSGATDTKIKNTASKLRDNDKTWMIGY